MKSMIRGAALGLAVVLGAQAAQAQGLSLGLGGGVVMPTGTYGDLMSTGWNATAVAQFKPAASPLGFQVDASYSRFGLQNDVDGSNRVISGTANAVFSFPSASPVRPYLLGGVGIYDQKITVGDASGSETKFGFNAGAGFDFALGGAKLFADARFHTIMNGSVDAETLEEANAYMIPITLGLRF
ncbi:MAG: outer membrane beta-barrel protein [Gemmatimonadales bacterium]